MHYHARWHLPAYELESAVSQRISDGSWLTATWGVAVFQMLPLANVWQHTHSALQTACIASACLLGLVIGQRQCYRQRRAATPIPVLLLGLVYLGSVLGWWLTGRQVVFSSVVQGMWALVMGVTSACWLEQRRLWPVVSEFASLTSSLTGLTLALALSWMIPTIWAEGIGLLFLVPLFLLDVYPSSQSPLRERLVLSEQSDPTSWSPLRFDERALSRGWWVLYLARRWSVLPLLLGSVLSVVTTALWSTVPTPFAAHLRSLHHASTLGWLVVAQFVALLFGWSVANKRRGSIGLLNRLIPPDRLLLCWVIALLSLCMLAASLVLLGLSFLQQDWWLALSLALYTVAGLTWNLLLPRLVPTIITKHLSLRHLHLSRDKEAVNNSAWFVYEQALEDRAVLSLKSWIGVLTALSTILCGLLIEQSTFDEALVIVGFPLFLVFLTGGTLHVLAFRQRSAHQTTEEDGTFIVQPKGAL